MASENRKQIPTSQLFGIGWTLKVRCNTTKGYDLVNKLVKL